MIDRVFSNLTLSGPPRYPVVLVAAVCLSLSPFLGSEELDIAKAYDLGVKSIESGQFDAGLKAVDEVLTQFGETGKEDYGAVFGHFHYLKGMLLVKKKEYARAIESFRTCHEKFPNDEGEDRPNCFLAESLSQWGGCLMALEKYDEASEKYRAALAIEEIYKPELNRLEAQVNLAKCLMLAGKSGRGKDFISEKMNAPGNTDAMKRSLFLILMSDWSPGAPLEDVKQYLNTYRSLLESDTLVNRYTKQNPVFNRLASDAILVKDAERAILWYDQMINPVEVGKAYLSRINGLQKQVEEAKSKPGSEAFVAETEKEIARLQSEIENQRQQLGDMLLGRGSALYASGQLDEARAAFLEHASRFPRDPERPSVLHNLAMCAVNLSQWEEANRYGMQFFREFPDHELRASMAKLLVDVLFIRGEYDEAHRVATNLQGTLSGTPEADVPTFIGGASLYHLARFEEAEEALSEYLQKFPDGERTEAANFYRCASMVNLQQWEKAVAELDGFLERYQQSDFRPTVLYYSGLSHLITGNYPLANSRIVELQANHPRADDIPNSYNVLGDILYARDKPYQEIAQNYLKALDMVENQNRGDADVAGYSLRQLITRAAEQEKWEVAAGYYDRFNQNYSDSSWRADVLSASVAPLSRTGRKEEAQQLLVDFVNEQAENPDSAELDKIFGTYLSFLRENFSLGEAGQQLDSFPTRTTPPAAALQAWLHLGKIELLTGSGEEGHEDTIKAEFAKLNALYESRGEQLSSYALVQIARNNSSEGGNLAMARKIYEFILANREGGEATGMALIELAKLEAAAGDESSRRNARGLFERVINEVDDLAVREDAVLGLARIAMIDEDYESGIRLWEEYRNQPGWRSARPEASYQYGVCLREQGDLDEAVATFVNVYSNFPGQLDWSTAAYIDAARIIHSKGRELDALKLLREMIQRMGHLEHPGVAEGRKLFFGWREEYVKEN